MRGPCNSTIPEGRINVKKVVGMTAVENDNPMKEVCYGNVDTDSIMRSLVYFRIKGYPD